MFIFSYNDKTEVLKGIDFSIPKGKKIALVGSSGAGKSTIADLLARFYDVSDGAILIDDVDVRDLNIDALRAHMGIVTQDSILFNDSIYANITFGAEGKIELEDVIAAAKAANAHGFISEMPDGYDTCIGDRGIKLSGGQRQRLSIARAIFKNPPILILDEATSALDTHSEQLVQEALEKLMQNRSALVIAHRLSTIQAADEILLIDDGKIIERGTHTELIQKGEAYFRLQQKQQLAE